MTDQNRQTEVLDDLKEQEIELREAYVELDDNQRKVRKNIKRIVKLRRKREKTIKLVVHPNPTKAILLYYLIGQLEKETFSATRFKHYTAQGVTQSKSLGSTEKFLNGAVGWTLRQ